MDSDIQNTSKVKNAPECLTDEMYVSGMKVTYVGMIVNALLIVVKLIGGILGTSAAMIADAVHSLSDFITDIGVLAGLRFLSKPADINHPYGHGRLETAISLLMGIIIIITGFGLFKNAAYSLFAATKGIFPHMPGYIALFSGIVSIISKEALYHYTKSVAIKTGSHTLKANAWHHRTDAFSSVGTVAGIGGAIILGDSWTILDPLAALFVSILVIKVGIGIGWETTRELSDEAFSHDRQEKLKNSILSVKGVQGIHNLRTRSLGRYASIDAHIRVDPDISVHDSHIIATEAENAARNTFSNIAFVTIHVEPGKKSLRV
ncbi:cation diffusion facilitator family transporter [Candidatus Latescibacterota bacterium]